MTTGSADSKKNTFVMQGDIREARPLLYRISSAMQQLAVSRATIYRMVARGELEMVRIGVRASRITSASVARLAAHQATTGERVEGSPRIDAKR